MTARNRETMRQAARYAPGLSWPIVDLIADKELGRVKHGELMRAVLHAVDGCASQSTLAALFGDLICALNGTDVLPMVTGLITSEVMLRATQAARS